MIQTDHQYDDASGQCRGLFAQKMKDYGSAWRILRLSSIVDQIYIKAWRIRNLETLAEQKVDDDIPTEFIGILNYSLMGLIQCELGPAEDIDMDPKKVLELYDRHLASCKKLMQMKNHDYGEAWRHMSQSSLTDLILMKILRMRSITEQGGATLVSEGIDANLQDIVNYAAFALIKVAEGSEKELA